MGKTRITAKGRVCTKCQKWKPWKSYHKDKSNKTGYATNCVVCRNYSVASYRRRTNYYQTNREHILAQKKASYKPLVKKNNDLKRCYGIDLEEFTKLWAKQKKRCYLCRKRVHISVRGKRKHLEAVVDHNHRNGEVRGLLCHSCNRALGLLKEDKKVIKRILGYL